jgi:hypothetical protein
MIDPQKTPYIAKVNEEYHIYDSPDGDARCGEKPASFGSTMNRSWRPELKHLIRMDGHEEIYEKIFGTSTIKSTTRTPLCLKCSVTAQSSSPLWYKVLQLPFERAPNSLIQSGHDVRLIQMPKGSLIGWVEHTQKPKYIEKEGQTVQGSQHRSRYGAWSSPGYVVPPFKGWTKAKLIKDTMYVSEKDHAALIRELSMRVDNTTVDEASMYIYPADDIYFMAQYTDGSYKYAGAWTFGRPDFPVKQMSYEEFLSSGYWHPISDVSADEETKVCPGCHNVCSLRSVSMTTLKNHQCVYCKWSTVQPQKPSLIPKE